MDNLINQLKISTPGRVCLFGEHQDYLQLPIVACAISLRISIEGTRRNDKLININPQRPKTEVLEKYEANSLLG